MKTNTLSFLVHAPSKVGKSTVAATAPLPILALDVEGGWKFIARSPYISSLYGRPLVLQPWDPAQGPPPRYDGSWDVCVVTVRDWAAVHFAYTWLLQAQHDFVSVAIDSISEVQRRCKENLFGTEQMKIQHWGQLLSAMDATIRGFRDLTLIETNPVRVVVFVAETRQSQSGKWIPYMQGQISTSLPYWMDIVGYLYVDYLADGNGQLTVPVRQLLIAPNAQFEAGERVQGLIGPTVQEPRIYDMLQRVYPQ